MRGSLLGPAYSPPEIEKRLNDSGARFERLPDTDLLPRVAGLLAEGKVIGWMDERMEFGPRALGARSILGDPRNPEMQDRINRKIKFREEFRPFAPSVLREKVSEHFELDSDSPYMLLVAPAKHDRLPAVTHVDGSARIQTVDREPNPRFHALLKAFERLTGYGVLVNTSFNTDGEPIVCTPEEAYRCFMRTDLDHLVIGPFLLHKATQPPWQDRALPALPAPRPGVPARIYDAFVEMARLLSRVTNPLLLGVVYLGVVTPIGWGLRLLGRNPLKQRRTATTFWRERQGEGKSDLARQF